VRAVFATATLASFLVWFFVDRDPRWFGAAGAFGLIWWGWDLLTDHVFQPMGDWVFGVFTGGVADDLLPANRLTLEDTVRLLESHIEKGASRKVEINSAIRLEEIYRTVKNDPLAARRVIDRVRERYPDAKELARYQQDDANSEPFAQS
jgi:hypothetical protein